MYNTFTNIDTKQSHIHEKAGTGIANSCFSVVITQLLRLYNKCWGDTITVSLPTLFF